MKTKNKFIMRTLMTMLLALAMLMSPISYMGTDNAALITAEAKSKFSLSDVPKYSKYASVEVNNNVPYFTAKEKSNTKTFESYHKLDKLKRCGVAYANVSKATMPTEDRGAIGMIKPSGWHTVKYNGVVDGNYLYNRCHLIAYCLTAENANKKNLITGTRYLNINGMLPYETKVANYVDKTGNHVLYRVTPIFEGKNLLASGVLMEAYSVEDKGKGIQYCVYCYNVQPGVKINYKTGNSKLDDSMDFVSNLDSDKNSNKSQTYVINTSSKKFHKTSCPYAKATSKKNKKTVKDTKQNLINDGYAPCKSCNP